MSADLAALAAQLRSAGERRGDWTQAGAFAEILAVIQHDHPEPSGQPEPSGDPAEDIADVFGLDPVDRALLVAACAPHQDHNVALAYGLLRGEVGAAAASVGLALELAGVDATSAAAFERLDASRPLRRHALVDVVGSRPWPARELVPADSTVAALAGARPVDPVLVHAECYLPVAGPLAGTDRLARAIDDAGRIVWVHGPPGSAPDALAAGALESLGLGWLAIDARRLPAQPGPAAAIRAACLLAGLRCQALVVVHAEALPTSATDNALDSFAGSAVPVIACSARPWNPDWSRTVPTVVEAPVLSPQERQTTWRASGLGPVIDRDPELAVTLAALRLAPDEIEHAAGYAARLAAIDDADVDAHHVRAAVRVLSASGGAYRADTGASSESDGPTFADLILPEHTAATLHRIVDWALHRDAVRAHGPLRHRGRGIAALFAGTPGTGKTLAAHVIAETLSLDLYHVDLSAVVDKYIGETEKNLEKVFEAAEALNVVLFFDEADALFGSRSEVRDARDRYANQEIAYLLQRMERFEGLTILATNLRGNLDRAFSRRMSFIVNFPDPDPPTRHRLWERHLEQLGELDADDPVDVAYLAGAAELSGGDIRNIVLAAAYDATAAGERVGMRHIVVETIREYRKLGRVMPDHGFGLAD